MTTTTDNLAKVPHPAGATRVYEWDDLEYGLEYASRYFTGSMWVVHLDGRDEDVTVEIDGIQTPDGRVERKLRVCRLNGDDPIAPGQARKLAAALIAAADEVERMNGYGRISESR